MTVSVSHALARTRQGTVTDLIDMNVTLRDKVAAGERGFARCGQSRHHDQLLVRPVMHEVGRSCDTVSDTDTVSGAQTLRGHSHSQGPDIGTDRGQLQQDEDSKGKISHERQR